MSSDLLKWIASGLIAAVLASTLWMAHAISPEQDGHSLLLAHVTPSPAAAASAPVTATH